VGDKVQHGSEFAQLAAKPQSTPGGENSSSLYFELKKGEMALNPENALRHTAAEAGMRQARAR
jgi:septal ring factor EnvC (AmiA/AmiB activator)